MIKYVNSLNSNIEDLTLPGLTYPNSPGYQNIPEGTLYRIVFGNHQFGAGVYTIQDKTFIPLLGQSEPTSGPPNKFYIIIYDHFTNKLSNLIDMGLLSDRGDGHHQMNIHITNDNRLMINYGNRIDPLHIRRRYTFSGPNYNPLSWTNWREMPTNRIEYPHVKTLSNGDMYDLSRSEVSGIWGGVVWVSKDNGFNWSIQNEYINFQNINDERPYVLELYVNDDILRVFVNHIENYKSEQKLLYYLESYDLGYTWQNIDNTYSQDTTNNPLNMPTLEANYKVLKVPEGGYIKAKYATMINGKPYTVGGIDADREIGLIYWDGSIWQTKKIICSGHTFALSSLDDWQNYIHSVVLKLVNNILHLYISEWVGAYMQISLFQSSDNGDSWEFIKQITHENRNHISARHNPKEGKDLMIISSTYPDLTSGKLFIEKI